ncbi:MAG: nucleotide-binding universal stress UspA family protein [Ulvibacter sp.]|jgi:nucleotide-binding universal stress UspA family protein
MKRKILVPVDFSTTAHNAYLYARELAKVFNCLVEVVHAYRLYNSGNTVPALMAESGKLKTIEKQLNDFIKDVSEQEKGAVLTKVEVVMNVQEGDPVPIIIRESKNENVFMIIMGTIGKHLLGDYILGSVASSVARKAGSPVLLISEGVSYCHFDNILYATNFESAQPEMVIEITNFANLFRAAVHFIHIKEASKIGDFIQIQKDIYEYLFGDKELAFTFHMKLVEADSVVNGLHDYADENQIDLIVLVNKNRGFLDSLMGESTSKNMALNLKYPLMIYHYSANSNYEKLT